MSEKEKQENQDDINLCAKIRRELLALDKPTKSTEKVSNLTAKNIAVINIVTE